MFVWPTLVRWIAGSPNGPFPGFSSHFVTADFWRTFAGPLFASLTFVTCGFAAVYTLGAKGFCTYGCPYGAVFGAVDRFAAGRILVNDACEQCGHCTATCTSNVLVHDEVRRFGMVVDPGCMKCMDCISVCPQERAALRLSRSPRPGLRPREAGPRIYDLSLAEEVFVLAVCALATVAFRGLYDGPPLLMAVALGGITGLRRSASGASGASLDRAHPESGPEVGGKDRSRRRRLHGARRGLDRVHGAQRRRAVGARPGRTRPGAHARDRDEVMSGSFAGKSYPPQHQRALDAAYRRLSFAERWGLFGVVGVKLDLAWCLLLRGDSEGAERRIHEAIDLAPSNLEVRQNLVDLLVARGRAADAIAALRGEDRRRQGRPRSPRAGVGRGRGVPALAGERRRGPGTEKAAVDAGLASAPAARPRPPRRSSGPISSRSEACSRSRTG
jgi:ferredoxin